MPDDLRIRILAHLKAYPRLTGYEIARALGAGKTAVLTALKTMERDGKVTRETGPKCEGDPAPVTRWSATGKTTDAATAAGQEQAE